MHGKPKIETMKELSEAIGVSRPTLSRYFQDPASVREATSRKIKARLREVDYVYNYMATRQNRKTSGLIGVVIPHFRDMFFASLIEAIERAAEEQNATVIVQSSDGEPRGEARAIARLRSMHADGAIIAPLGATESQEALELASADFPIVFVDARPSAPIPGTDFVGTDNASSIGQLVDHLCETGAPPVFLGMPKLNSNAVERDQAYELRMEQLGHAPCHVADRGIEATWRFEAFGQAVMEANFGAGRHLSDTILCANDRLAIGAMRAAHAHGLFSGGSGFRIAGHDDHPLSRYMHPDLTTAAQDTDGIGKDAVRLLCGRTRRERTGPAESILKQTVLRARASTRSLDDRPGAPVRQDCA